MRYFLLTVLSVAMISSSVHSSEQLIVTRAGKVEAAYSISGWQPGDIYFYLDQDSYTRYLWQGEDSIDYRIKNGLLRVNDKIVGIDLRQVKLTEHAAREGIITAIVDGLELKDLYQFPDLKAVQIPYVDGNVDFSVLDEMVNLVALDIENGVQNDSLLFHLKSLRNLKSLYLGWGMTDTGLATISCLSNLKMLYLAHASITDEGLTYITGFDNLEILILGGIRSATETHITDRGLTRLAELTNLRELYLGCSDISGSGLGYLSGLDKLEYLNLFATNVDDGGLRYLLQLDNLVSLNLCGTEITDAGVAILAQLPRLNKLNVGFTNITDHGLMELARISSLKTLIVWGYDTPLTEVGLEGFRKLRPDCELLIMDFWPD